MQFLFKKTIFGILSTLMIVLFISPSINAQTKTSKTPQFEISSKDPWTVKQVISVSGLNKELKSKKNHRPVVLQIGFDFLYKQGHIPGSIYVGAASSEKGIVALKKEVKKFRKDKNIVIYCGCCPMDHCPNVRPAFETLEKLGYKNIKVLYLPGDFEQDWADKGYKVSKN